MGASIRIATDDDRPALAALRHRWNEENAGAPIEDPGFDEAFTRWWDAERATRTFFIAEEDAEAIGMANVTHYERMPVAGDGDAGRWGYVGNVFVVPERRNGGIGQLLMDDILAWAARDGLAHLRLAPSPRSFSFYERLGYRTGAVVELDPPSLVRPDR
jgi:GNAT superfamily N-acetyltransferase